MILSLPISTLQTPGRYHALTPRCATTGRSRPTPVRRSSRRPSTVVAVVLGAGVWGLAAGVVIKAPHRHPPDRPPKRRALTAAIAARLAQDQGKRDPASGSASRPARYTFVAREQGLNILLVATLAGIGPLGIWTFTNRIFQLPSLAFNSLYVVGFPAMSNILARGEDIGPILLRMVRRAAIVGTFIFGVFAATSPS